MSIWCFAHRTRKSDRGTLASAHNRGSQMSTQQSIHSGDFLALSKIRDRWGGFETLEKWVTRAQAGHTAVCLRDEDDKLWVGESGHQNEPVQSFTCILLPTTFFSSLSSFLQTRCPRFMVQCSGLKSWRREISVADNRWFALSCVRSGMK